MELYDWLANVVRGFHVVLLVSLGLAVTAAAFGWFSRHRMAFLFWPTFFITMIWSALPVFCPITSLELWLRRQADPGATYADPLPNRVFQSLLWNDPSTLLLTGAALLVIALGIFGFWRTYYNEKSHLGPVEHIRVAIPKT